jgi:serine phosphatase RsbU (regulator of sigma subunit)
MGRLAEQTRDGLLAQLPPPPFPLAAEEIPSHWPLSSMRKQIFRKGDWLFRKGDQADRMFYLHRGLLLLPEIRKHIRPGQVLGEMGLFSPRHERTASALCEEDVEVYTMGREEMVEFFRQDPSLALNLMQLSCTRFMENVRAETEAKERIRSELRIAHDIQVSMLPRAVPTLAADGAIEILAAMDPAKEVGGDFYDFFPVGGDKLCVLIGDASGKGVPAALFMSVGKALLKAEATRGLPPHEVLSRVNQLLCSENHLCMFATVACLMIEPARGAVEICNAGHNPPLLFNSRSKVRELEAPRGMALGVLDDVSYASCTLSLNPGDSIFLYTDGVTEAANPNQELFTQTRLEACLARLADQKLPDLIAAVKEEVADHADIEPQSDDITMVALRYRGHQG